MNRKILRSLAVALLFVAACWIPVSNAAPRHLLLRGLPGGWSKADVKNAEVVKAAEEAIKAESSESEKLQLLSIKSAEQHRNPSLVLPFRVKLPIQVIRGHG